MSDSDAVLRFVCNDIDIVLRRSTYRERSIIMVTARMNAVGVDRYPRRVDRSTARSVVTEWIGVN